MTNDSSLPPGDGPAGGSAPRPPSPTQSPPPEDRRVTAVTAGTQIVGTYEIEQLISSGGMGEVYRGRNIHNGEPVAIKIVLPSLAHDPKIVALFQKEAMVLGRLSHDAIVRYHVFTNDPVIGRPSLIMEFVAGTALGDQLDRGPMPLEDVKVLLRRLASGLDKAHRAGVVHRDLSPDNVILEDGQVEHAKIIDFGIAKSTKIGGGTLLQGQFAGKFNFVSPEQLGAFGGTVDGRSDIYSLALLIAAACRGKLMDMGSSIVDAVGKRASVPDLQGVPPEIAPLLAHMLEPDPANRPESMAAVIMMLDNPGQVPPRPGAAAPDPNRTIISASLPPINLPPELGGGQVTGGLAAGQPAPGQTGVPLGTPQPTGVPHGAPQQTGAPGDLPQVDVDASPFGPSFEGTPTPAPAPPAAHERKRGKGGMILAAIVLVAAIGGAGAWFGGLIPAAMAPAAQDGPAAANDAPPAPVETAANETAAPAPAAPVPAAAESAQPQAGAPVPADPVPADPVPADPVPAAESASEEPAPAAREAAAAAPAPAEPAPPPEPAAAPSDPAAWLAGYAMPECVSIRPQPGAEGFEAFAASEAALAPVRSILGGLFADAPPIALQTIEQNQCPVLDFVNANRASAGPTVTLQLQTDGGTLKNGSAVTGQVAGVGDRSAALFLVNGAGGATNLKPWLARSSDGAVSFSVAVSLAEGAPRGQMILAVVTDEPLTKLDGVPNGVTARALVPFMQSQITATGQQAASALAYFRIED
ncbi:MAG: serine/threonine protein kinase [Defluviimonas sp.]|nr:serine/threonine protein kinase [Defluviimonas sp.]